MSDANIKNIAKIFAEGLSDYASNCLLIGCAPDPILLKQFIYKYQRAEAGIVFEYVTQQEAAGEFKKMAETLINSAPIATAK